MERIRYISVILPLRLEWEPFYALPTDNDALAVEPGDRVKVRFANKLYSGVVSSVDVTPDTDASRIRAIEGIEHGLEKILPQEIELWRKVSEYYLCTIGEVYKAAYPASKINLEEAHAAALAKACRRREDLLESMRQKVSRIRERIARKEELISKAKEGTKARARYTEEAEKIRKELSVAEEALRTAEANTMADKGPAPVEHPDTDAAIILSDAQRKAYEEIESAFKKRVPAMLYGVTGSGKTEIYIQAAKEATSKGNNVLYLVPEIALSRQLEERLEKHFSGRLLTFHSAETAASRRNTAEAIRKNTGLVILGTRSALFLPHHDLGLIIVDEEHDSSYKQDSPAPRYNGRDTALMLAQIHKCNIILGSATPSLEEIYNCGCGKHVLVQLTERYHGTADSEIEIIDTKAERRKRGMIGSFSRKLIERIRKELADGGQVMILRSRRSWAPALQCEECGDIPKCPRCNVSLCLHKNESYSRMTCHYCGQSFAFTGTCTKCNGNLKSIGAGTQKIEEEAQALFPDARIARLDSDSAQNRKFESDTIRGFGEGNIDILIGTQMLTKGFDFGNLSLVAVIAADAFLGIQDFRADEKAVQILEQFRGRCGRRGRQGVLVIQTSQPEHPVYKRFMHRDSNQEMIADFLIERKDFGFPPYTRIVEITLRDTYEDRIQKAASLLASEFRQGFDMTGPYAPAVDRVAGQHIRIIRISMKKDRNLPGLKRQLCDIIRRYEKKHRYEGHITVNVDPA